MQITRFDPDELAAELRGHTSFRDFAPTFTPPGTEPSLPSSTTSPGAGSGLHLMSPPPVVCFRPPPDLDLAFVDDWTALDLVHE